MRSSWCRGDVLLLIACSWFIFDGSIGCKDLTTGQVKSTEGPEQVTLQFSLTLDAAVYKQTKFGKPPQFALWLEDLTGMEIRTVWVTEKTGKASWGAEIVRPVSLPYWVSRWKKETQSDSFPTPENPVVDAVTGATPTEHFTCRVEVPAGSAWDYYIEVNVSGDYNDTFPAVLQDGSRDLNANGQPSIIYKGRITALPGRRSVPRLIGRTEQFEAVSRIVPDLEGISLAGNLLSKIEVAVTSPD